MKKPMMMFAALTIGTAAFAQTMPMQGSPPATNTPAPATPDTSAPMTGDTATPAPPPSDPGMSTPTTPATPTTPDATMPPPAADAPPAPPAPMVSPAPAAAPADPSTYPSCSRTVTDKCTQTGKRMARKK